MSTSNTDEIQFSLKMEMMLLYNRMSNYRFHGKFRIFQVFAMGVIFGVFLIVISPLFALFVEACLHSMQEMRFFSQLKTVYVSIGTMILVSLPFMAMPYCLTWRERLIRAALALAGFALSQLPVAFVVILFEFVLV